MHYSGVEFRDMMVCVHKVDRGGREEICGNSPTAPDVCNGSTLFKCPDHHSMHQHEIIVTSGAPLGMRNARPVDPDYEREIKMFVDAMRYKLHVNRHKGKWETQTIEDVFRSLRREVNELEEAIKGGRMVEIMLEAADIANFAMIAANIAVSKELKR